MTALRVALAAVVAAVAFAGCGGGEEAPDRAVDAIESRELLPATLLDLNVAPEPVKDKLKGSGDTYAERLGLYSFRKGELLQATLQVTRLGSEAKVKDEEFRLGVVRGIATGEISEMRMADKTVWLSQSLRQNVAIWFDDRQLFVLSAREEFDRPRTLLRQLVAMEMKL